MNKLYDIQVPREPQNAIFWQKVILFQFVYSLAGLILGLATIIGGIVLFMNGIAGKTNWTAKIIGAESNISDAAPGTILFIVGLFLVIFTRFKLRIKDSFSNFHNKNNVEEISTVNMNEDLPIESSPNYSYTSNEEDHESLKYLQELKMIVDTAISESHTYSWSSFRDYDDIDALFRLRNYFGRYFLRIIPIISCLEGKSIFEGSKILNDLFVKTALNHILDAWYASYVIKDFVIKLSSIMENKGAGIWRFHFVKESLAKTWSDIDSDNGEYSSSRVNELKRILNSKIINA